MTNEKRKKEWESRPKGLDRVRKPTPGEIIDFTKRRQLMDLEIPVKKFVEEMAEMDPVEYLGWYVLFGDKYVFVVKEAELEP